MTQTVDMSEDSTRAERIRKSMTDELRADGIISSRVVEAAFLAVPREKFAPAGTPLEVAYNAANSVATKRDEHGALISSISAPFIQARMIEQAMIKPGMRVLEIGSGGYNAALLAEVVGPEGHVYSADIDPEVTERASTCLQETGYGDRVTVVLADAEHAVPEHGPFGAILVTVGAWDISPTWLEQLAPDGVLVVPLRMNGITRVIAFQREGDHLVSVSAEVAGFVAMQGDGEHPEQVFVLPDAEGRKVRLRFEDEAPQDPSLLDGVLATERTIAWSGITIPNGVSFADLHLWFASFLPGFCKLAADKGDRRRERAPLVPLRCRARRLLRLPGGAPGDGGRRSRVRGAGVRGARRRDRDCDGHSDPGMGPPGPGPGSHVRVLADRQRPHAAPRRRSGPGEDPRSGHDLLAPDGLNSHAACGPGGTTQPRFKECKPMALALTLDAVEDLDLSGAATPEDFDLDLRVVVTTTPIPSMLCDTGDGCGATCATSACNSNSADPV